MSVQEGTHGGQESVRVVLKNHVSRARDLDLAGVRLGREHLLGRFGAQDVRVSTTHD
jgi:hypothetical protein